MEKYLIILVILATIYYFQTQVKTSEGFEDVKGQTTGAMDDTQAINTLAKISKELMAGGLTVPGNMNVTGNMKVDGKMEVNNKMTVNHNMNIDGYMDVKYDMKVHRNMQVDGDMRVDRIMSVYGALTVIGQIKVRPIESGPSFFIESKNKLLEIINERGATIFAIDYDGNVFIRGALRQNQPEFLDKN